MARHRDRAHTDDVGGLLWLAAFCVLADAISTIDDFCLWEGQ